MHKPVIHHVFFWLKNPDSKEDLNQLLNALPMLAKIETVRKLHVGVPAATEKREVIDDSYAVSELIYFDDLEGQEIYQTHPLHLQFIKENGHLWNKVVVYDSIDV